MTRTSLVDMPLEILVEIFSYLHLNLSDLMDLASVCHKLRAAAFCCPIPVRLPLSDQKLQLMKTYKIPVKSLCNVQPSMYVAYQLAHLNLNRLMEAQLVANDYLSKSKKTILSPQYWTLLRHIYPCFTLKGISTTSFSLKSSQRFRDFQTNVPKCIYGYNYHFSQGKVA